MHAFLQSVVRDRWHFSSIRFYMRLKSLAGPAQLCPTCVDEQMATGIMTGVRDTAVRQKLFAITPFPKEQEAVNVCRSEETASSNASTLHGKMEISAVHFKGSSQQQSGGGALKKGRCGSCGRFTHRSDTPFPAIGQTCNWCGAVGHFSPCCPAKLAGKPGTRQQLNQPPMSNGPHQRDSTGHTTSTSVNRHICIRSVQSSRRRAPTIAVNIRCAPGQPDVTIRGVVPDAGAEVAVGGLDILHALGLKEGDLRESSFDLVMADKKTPLLSIGQLDMTVTYGEAEAVVTTVICPEMPGLLLAWVDCIALDILPRDYPRPIIRPSQQSQSDLQSKRRRNSSLQLHILHRTCTRCFVSPFRRIRRRQRRPLLKKQS